MTMIIFSDLTKLLSEGNLTSLVPIHLRYSSTIRFAIYVVIKTFFQKKGFILMDDSVLFFSKF